MKFDDNDSVCGTSYSMRDTMRTINSVLEECPDLKMALVANVKLVGEAISEEDDTEEITVTMDACTAKLHATLMILGLECCKSLKREDDEKGVSP